MPLSPCRAAYILHLVPTLFAIFIPTSLTCLERQLDMLLHFSYSCGEYSSTSSKKDIPEGYEEKEEFGTALSRFGISLRQYRACMKTPMKRQVTEPSPKQQVTEPTTVSS